MLTLLALGQLAIMAILYVVSVAVALLLRPKNKSKDVKGADGEPTGNPVGPTTPIQVIYGAPRHDPHEMTKWKTSQLNSDRPVKEYDHHHLYSLGWGPIAGSELMIWLDGNQVWTRVDESSPPVARRLTAIDSTRKIWGFPTKGVVADSVAIYWDGVLKAASAEAGSDVLIAKSATYFTNQECVPKTFNFTSDGSIKGNVSRVGCHWPFDGIVDKATVVVRAELTKSGTVKIGTRTVNIKNFPFGFFSSFFGGSNASPFSRYIEIRAEELKFSKTRDSLGGKEYFYADMTGIDLTAGGASGPQIKRWIIEFWATTKVKIVVASDGSTTAIFDPAVPAGIDVTATYKASYVEKDLFTEKNRAIEWELRLGTSDQAPLITGYNGIPREVDVGKTLTEAVPIRYSSRAEVDDMIIDLTSDAMYALSDKGGIREARRKIMIRLKESVAPDTLKAGTDPSKGWVDLIFPTGKSAVQVLKGRSTGSLLWRYSIADLLAETRRQTYTTGQTSFPSREFYDIEITALDNPGDNDEGEPDAENTSGLSLALVTEIVRQEFSFPFHAMLLVKAPDTITWSTLSAKVAGRVVLNMVTGLYAYSRNPTWCMADMITHPIYGGGQVYGYQDIIYARAIASAAFHDSEAINDDGTKEVRCLLDMVCQDNTAIGDQLERMASGSEVICVPEGDGWTFIINRDDLPVSYELNDDNVKVSEANLNIHGLEEHPNMLDVVYRPEPMHEEDSFLLRIKNDEPEIRHVRQASMPGVARLTQAIRAGTAQLKQFEFHDHGIEAIAEGWGVLRYEAGDIIYGTFSKFKVVRQKYRAMAFGLGSNLVPFVGITRHDPRACDRAYQGPSQVAAATVTKSKTTDSAPGSTNVFTKAKLLSDIKLEVVLDES